MYKNNVKQKETVDTDQTLWGDKPWHTLDAEMKKRYGEKVYRLSLNGGMTCPNRDGKIDYRGCIFCSAGGSGDFAAPVEKSISDQMIEAKARITKKSHCRFFIAYFQAYTNTYAPINVLRQKFYAAIEPADIVALSIATRPDCLSDEVIDLLKELQAIKPVWVELGLQTIHPKSMAYIRSGFDFQCFETAVHRLKAAGIEVIAHLILGLPGESQAMMLESVKKIAEMPIDGIKLHLLHVLKGTDLALAYQQKPFECMTMDVYIDLLIACLERLPKAVVIHRLTGDGPRKLLIAPTWSTDKKRILNTLFKRMRARGIFQGDKVRLKN